MPKGFRVLLPRVGADVLTRAGFAANAIGFGLIACLVFVPRVEFLLAAIVVFTLGDGLFQPPMNAIISNAAPADAQGLVQGANQSQQAMARMRGPPLAAVLSPFSAAAPYWAGGVDRDDGCRDPVDVRMVGAIESGVTRQGARCALNLYQR